MLSGPDGTIRLASARRMEELACAAGQMRRCEQLLDTIVTGLFGAGLSLQSAIGLPPDAARQHIAAALGHLDDTIRLIRDTAFAAGGHGTPDPVPADAST
jgi:hypothetical protein